MIVLNSMKIFFLIVAMTTMALIPLINAQEEYMRVFEEANTDYQEQEYDLAIEKYESIISAGKISSDLYYNLANAYYNNGNLSKSLLNYERAIKLKSGDQKIRQNIEIARNVVNSDIIEVQDFILLRWWKTFSSLFSTFSWMLIQIILCGLSLGSIYFWKYKEDPKRKLQGFISGFILFMVFLIALSAGITSQEINHNANQAVLMESEMLKTGPDKRSSNSLQLSEGVKVKIVDQIEEWYKVQLMNKQEGWLEISKVEII